MDEIFYQEIQELYRNFQTFTPFSTGKLKESGDKLDSVSDNHFELLISKLDIISTTLSKGSDEYVKVITMKASLIYEKAKLFLTINCLHEAKELLETALTLINEYTLNTQVVFLHLRIINNLSYILSKTEEFERAKELLEAVIECNVPNPLIYSTDDLFRKEQIENAEDPKRLTKLMINNMQMLCWLYEELGMNDLYTLTQHKSLQKQIDVADGDPLNWASRCCRLANLFLTQRKWSQARYHLAAAEAVLDRLELQINTSVELNKAQAELTCSWVQFGLQLFTVSKRLTMEQIYGAEFRESVENLQQVAESSVKNELQFTGLVMNVPQVPVAEISNTVQARQLFMHTHKWLKRLRLFYTLRECPLQYVNSVLDLSELYKYLAFYEQDIESKYNVHKKRYDSLEALSNILKEIRPNCYVLVSVELLREITDAQIELMSLNLKKLYIAEDLQLNEQNLKRRINAVTNINTKLGTVEKSVLDNEESNCADKLPAEPFMETL